MLGDFKIIESHLLANEQVTLHTQQQLGELVANRVIDQCVLQYSKQLGDHLSTTRRFKSTEEFKTYSKKVSKQIGKMENLKKQDRIIILNNRFNDSNDILLKVSEQLQPSQLNIIFNAVGGDRSLN